MLPHLILQAAEDGRLWDQDRRLLILLHRELDYVDARPVKVQVIRRLVCNQRGQPMQKANAFRSLRRLASHGYLDRGPLLDGVRTYRLRASRAFMVAVSPVTPQTAA